MSLLLAWSGGPSWSDDDPPQPTQDEVRANTRMAMAPDQTEPAQPPQPIHPLSKAQRKELKDEHRVYSGKDWKAITPEQRDAVMRGLRERNAPGSIFLIDVRTGDIYKFDPLPPTEDRTKTEAQRLSEIYGVPIRYFDMTVDLVKLPVSVGSNSSAQTDRSVDAVLRGAAFKF
ncbi:hypothetical protein [Dongia sp. agr-C8]